MQDFGGGGGRSRERPISVHAARRRSAGAAHLVAEAAPRPAARARGHRCRHRPAARRARGRPDRRSRHAPPAWALPSSDRQCARRRIRAGAGLHDLQPVQPAAVSRRDGGRAGILAEPGGAEGTLCQHLGRGGQRHQATQAVAGTTSIAPTAAAAAAASPRRDAGTAIWRRTRSPTPAAATPRPARRSACRRRPWCRFRPSAITPPARPVSVNHTGTSVSTSISFNLPEGVSLGARAGGHRPHDEGDPDAGHIRGAPTAPPSCFSRALGNFGCCCSRRCSPSTWCSACFTRATASR